MKNFINMLKHDKQKLIILIICIIILVGSIFYFVSKKSVVNKTKDEDQAIQMLLDTFYGKEVDKNASEIMLGKTSDKYFGEIKQESYNTVYDQLKILGKGALVDDKSAVDIANDYTDASMSVLKNVKKIKIVNKQDVENGYQFQIEVTPGNLNDAYKKGNDCAFNLITKTQKEDPNFAEMEGYEYAIYYKCMADGMNGMGKGNGEKTTITVVLKKNDKGQFIPTEESLKALLSAAY